MFSVHWGLCSLCTFVGVGSFFWLYGFDSGGGGGGDNRAEHLAFVALCPTTVQMQMVQHGDNESHCQQMQCCLQPLAHFI